jgi:methionyl-tRNA synthetase
MSKSVGNVLDPFALVSQYGVDYVRYYMASEFHFGNDGDFSHEAFCHRINVDLANDLGNLAQRALTLVDRHCGGVVPTPGKFTEDDEEILRALRENIPFVRRQLQQQGVKHICDSVINIAKMGNRYIDTQAPWVLVKSDPARLQTVLYVLIELLRHSGIMLQPVMPQTCALMLDLLGVPQDAAHRNFAALALLGPSGGKIGSPKPIFPKLVYTPPAAAIEAADKGVSAKKADFSAYDAYDEEQVKGKLLAVGEEIRAQKALKAGKKELEPLVQELLYLKER